MDIAVMWFFKAACVDSIAHDDFSYTVLSIIYQNLSLNVFLKLETKNGRLTYYTGESIIQLIVDSVNLIFIRQ